MDLVTIDIPLSFPIRLLRWIVNGLDAPTGSGLQEMHDIIDHKINRLRESRSAKPRVLDLFAGCGGLSLGFYSAGFDIAAAVEIDPIAARTHGMNFYQRESRDLIARHAIARDITAIEPEELTEEFGPGDPERAIDVIVGGPPCQAYARIGRAKLREVANHPTAFKVDPRANLYLRYLHYIARLKPLAILMENVPDIMNFGGHNVVQEICDALNDFGYDAHYSLINSAHHGVPQMRDRVYMLAYRRELRAKIAFPMPTHQCTLSSGYMGQRAVALKLVDLLSRRAYCDASSVSSALTHAITAKQALDDLPPITLHMEGKQKRGIQRFDELARYRPARPSSYARQLRNWVGFENNEGVYDHVMRRLPRDTRIFQAMVPGSEYPVARAVAEQLFALEAKQQMLKPDSAEWYTLQRKMVPPYDPGKFPNRWWKLEENKPVRTLTAHIGKDTYTHIHYDSDQGRVISVREAARLQSFPDGFRFCGAMNAAYRQIGNAVPPLMAKCLAEVMKRELFRTIKLTMRGERLIAAE
jgi:DNA (cytosine-5)-methyltransferase 1